MKIVTQIQGRKVRVALRACGAFTMVEIALCLAIIAFALVAIIGVLPIGMSVQKDNREQTIINFDAKYLLDAIRSGTLGQDELTNYIVSITNIYQVYDVNTNAQGSPVVNWYNSFTNGPGQYYQVNNQSPSVLPILTNGHNILGLLTTPKYTPDKKGFFRSNYVTADFRAITGSPMDQGGSSASKDFAFTYRVFPEVSPFPVGDISQTNYAVLLKTDPNWTNRFAYAVLMTNLQANLSDVRLRIRWPILPNHQLGPGNQVFRTVASGQIRATNVLAGLTMYFYQSQNYTNGAQLLP